MATAELEKRVQALEAQVQSLEDRDAIQTLRFCYHEQWFGQNQAAIAP